MLKNLFALPAFNLDAGGAGGGGGAGGPAAGGAAGGGQASGGGGSAPAGGAQSGAKNPFTGEAAGGGQPPPAAMGHNGGPRFPDGLPDHLKGTNEGETLSKVWAAYSGAREEIAKRGAPPKDASEYAIEFDDDLKAVFGDPSTSAELKIFKTVAHRHGLTKEQVAGLARDYHAGLLSEKIVTPIDYMKEARAIVGDAARGRTEEQIKQEAGKIWTDTAGWVDGLVGSKAVSKEGGERLKGLLETADGIAAVRALRQMTLESAINPGAGQGAPGGISKDDLVKRQADPRNQPFSGKFEQAFYDETNRLFQGFYAPQSRA